MKFISTEIIRGSRWPPARQYVYVSLLGLENWPTFLLDQNGEPILDQSGDAILSQETTLEDWSWDMVVFSQNGEMQVKVGVTAEVSGTGMEVALSATPDETSQIAADWGERVTLMVKSVDESGNVSYYPQTEATVRVRDTGEN